MKFNKIEIMGNIIGIVGKSGTGKSTSYGTFPELDIIGLDPSTTVMINVTGQPLPFKGWKEKYKGKIMEGGNYMYSNNASVIIKALEYISKNRLEIEDVVIDDAQYIMAFEFMQRANETGYKKYSDIGININNLLQTSLKIRDNINVFYLWHPENDRDSGYKMKTVGAMIDNYLTLEGLFNIILYSKVLRGDNRQSFYQFVTNNDGEYPAKSPIGMFEKLYIPNDLGYVKKSINNYN